MSISVPTNVAQTRPLRVLAVGEAVGHSLISNLATWAAEKGVTLESEPDLPGAARRLSSGRWDAVVAVLGDHADQELAWWSDALRGAEGEPRLVPLVRQPSMGLVLQAERLGVLDIITFPGRREDILRTLDRLGATRAAGPIPAQGRSDAPPARLAEVEAREIRRALEYTNGQIGVAAALLGIHRNTLARKVKRYGL
jgi:ActR/RegA family two-component response regulator